MKVSVIIPVYNEGRDLEATVALVWASDPEVDEIIVVDDHSTEEVAPRLASFPGVKVIRTQKRVGAGPTKRLGIEASTGDIAIVIDAHMRMPMDWLNAVKAACELFPDSIFCTVCRGFEMKGAFIAAGAKFTRKATDFIYPEWKPRSQDFDAIDKVPMIYGGCYVIPRKIWDAIGGINKAFFGWGCEEQDLSLRAHLCGFEVRRINGLVIPHKFQRKLAAGDYRLNGWEPTYNLLVTYYTLFDDEVFNKFFNASIGTFPELALKEFARNREAVEEARQDFQARRTKNYSDLYALCGLIIPTDIEQSIAAARGVSVNPALGRAHYNAIVNAVPENGRMLEWGSGDSTLVMRELLGPNRSLVSIEHSKAWADKIGGNIKLVECPGAPSNGFIEEEMVDGSLMLDTTHPYVIAAEEFGKFDVIFVDGIYRNACLLKATELLNPGGSIFIHDSQRDWYQQGKAPYVWDQPLPSCIEYEGPELLRGRLK